MLWKIQNSVLLFNISRKNVKFVKKYEISKIFDFYEEKKSKDIARIRKIENQNRH